MRTNVYDVNLDGDRLTIVRLQDGAPIVDAVIPADARATVAAVLNGEPGKRDETPPVQSAEIPVKTVKKRTRKKDGTV